MRKLYTLVFALLVLALNANAQGLFISEVADPSDNASDGRFVELYNAGTETVDFSTTVMYLSRQSNGGTTWGDVQLTGSVAAGETYIIAGSSNFSTVYSGVTADIVSGVINSNGDDAYFLYTGGDHTAGTLYDIYGAIDTDGTGTDWEFLDGRAYRKGGVVDPNTTWTATEWEVIMPANAADFNPGTHDPTVVVDETAPVWEATYPQAANIEDVQFDLLAQLDETSTVYYVVLDNDATAPTVAEVIAGTGSAGAAAVVSGSFTAGTSETTETVTGLVVETSYDVYVVAQDDEATPNVQAAVSLVEITTIIMPDVLLKADFDADLSPFTAVSVSGDQVWGQDSYGGNGYAKISGYASGTSYVNEDWLISPGIDLAAATGEVLSFETANNYGDANSTLKVKISSDFNGTYDATSIAAATWDDITDQFTLSSGGSWTFVASGDLDFTPYAEDGTGYLAFVYECPDANAGTWELDNVLYTGYLVPGSDATLSDLQVDGTTIEGFDAATTTYTYELAAGTTTVPTVTATPTDDAASAVVTPATDLAGDAAARTTTVLVTAQDGSTTQTYSILFDPIVEVADIAALRAATDMDRKYMVTGEVVLTQKDSYRNKKYLEDATGAIEIDDNDGVITTSYSIGDGITGVTGKLNDYYGMLQLMPTADPGAATSTGNTVEPQVLTVSEFTSNFESYEAEFVKIEGVGFADAGSTFDNGQNYKVGVGDDSTVFRTNFYDVLSGSIPKMADIQGVAIWHYSEAKVAPRLAADLMVYSSDASLSDLLVDGTTISGFAAATYAYVDSLEYGTTTVPTVTYVTADDNATATVVPATDLAGDEAARTTTVTVSAQDGTEQVYTIVFAVKPTSIADNKFVQISVYPSPASNQIIIDGVANVEVISIYNILGSEVKTIYPASEKEIVNITDLKAGIYLINVDEKVVRFIKN